MSSEKPHSPSIHSPTSSNNDPLPDSPHDTLKATVSQQEMVEASQGLAEKIDEMNRQNENLMKYEELKIRFDRNGISLLQTDLIKAFAEYCKLLNRRVSCLVFSGAIKRLAIKVASTEEHCFNE